MKTGDKVRLVIDATVVGTNHQYNWMNVQFGEHAACVPMREEPGYTVRETGAGAPEASASSQQQLIELLASHVRELAKALAKSSNLPNMHPGSKAATLHAAANAVRRDIETTNWRANG